jgi:hypothetical protein
MIQSQYFIALSIIIYYFDLSLSIIDKMKKIVSVNLCGCAPILTSPIPPICDGSFTGTTTTPISSVASSPLPRSLCYLKKIL